MIKRFPKLKRDSLGGQAQSLEGCILRQVILQGMGKGIVCLPVDDAAAVLQQHEKWAVDAMLKAWKRVVSTNGIWAGARTCLFFVRNPDWKSLSKRSKTKFMVIG